MLLYTELQSFSIKCTTFTIFKSTFKDGELCECGTVRKLDATLRVNCRKTLPFDIILEISVMEATPMGENCNLTFNYFLSAQQRTGNASVRVTIFPREVMSQSFFVSDIVTRTSSLFSPYVSSSIVPLFALSSLFVSQSEMEIFAMSLTQMR